MIPPQTTTVNAPVVPKGTANHSDGFSGTHMAGLLESRRRGSSGRGRGRSTVDETGHSARCPLPRPGSITKRVCDLLQDDDV